MSIQQIKIEDLNFTDDSLVISSTPATTTLTSFTTEDFSNFVLTSSQISSLNSYSITGTSYDTFSTIASIKRKKYVIAGSKLEYDKFLKKKNYDETEYEFLENVDQIEHLDAVHGFYIGSWRDREDIADIKETIIKINQRW